MSRLRNNFLFLALCPFLLGQAWARDAAVTAVAALIDPMKLVTLRGDRANPRVLKCVYWLNDARRRGIEQATVMDEAQVLNQSAQQARAPLVTSADRPRSITWCPSWSSRPWTTRLQTWN